MHAYRNDQWTQDTGGVGAGGMSRGRREGETYVILFVVLQKIKIIFLKKIHYWVHGEEEAIDLFCLYLQELQGLMDGSCRKTDFGLI